MDVHRDTLGALAFDRHADCRNKKLVLDDQSCRRDACTKTMEITEEFEPSHWILLDVVHLMNWNHRSRAGSEASTPFNHLRQISDMLSLCVRLQYTCQKHTRWSARKSTVLTYGDNIYFCAPRIAAISQLRAMSCFIMRKISYMPSTCVAARIRVRISEQHETGTLSRLSNLTSIQRCALRPKLWRYPRRLVGGENFRAW